MQPLHILFITDPLAHFKITKDSTYAMMQAAAEHGHILYVCESHQLTLDENQVYACATPLTLIIPPNSHSNFSSTVEREGKRVGQSTALTKRQYDLRSVVPGNQHSGADHHDPLALRRFLGADVPAGQYGEEPHSAADKVIRMKWNWNQWYQLAETQTIPLQDFDAVLMRKDPPFDLEYVTATWLLSHAQRQGAKVFNDPGALRDHSEKLAIAEFPQFTPPTLVSHSLEQLRVFHQKYHDIIIKPLDGMGGTGVFRVRQDGLNLSAIIETLGQQGARNLMAQQFIPEIEQGDKRILLIAGQVIPFSLARIPAPGEVRGNLAVGGTGIAQPLTARDLDIAQTLAPILWQRGILIAGIDIIGPYLTEINITSPTCFREIQQQTQADAAAITLTALEKICQNAL